MAYITVTMRVEEWSRCHLYGCSCRNYNVGLIINAIMWVEVIIMSVGIALMRMTLTQGWGCQETDPSSGQCHFLPMLVIAVVEAGRVGGCTVVVLPVTSALKPSDRTRKQDRGDSWCLQDPVGPRVGMDPPQERRGRQNLPRNVQHSCWLHHQLSQRLSRWHLRPFRRVQGHDCRGRMGIPRRIDSSSMTNTPTEKSMENVCCII